MRKFRFTVPLTRHHYPKPGACITQDTILTKCNDGWAVSRNNNGFILQITDQKTLDKRIAMLKPLYKGIYFVESNNKYRLKEDAKAKVKAEYIRLSSEFTALKREEIIVLFLCSRLFDDFVYPALFGFEDYEQLRDLLMLVKDNKLKTQKGDLVYLTEKYEGMNIKDIFTARYEELKAFADILKEIE